MSNVVTMAAPWCRCSALTAAHRPPLSRPDPCPRELIQGAIDSDPFNIAAYQEVAHHHCYVVRPAPSDLPSPTQYLSASRASSMKWGQQEAIVERIKRTCFDSGDFDHFIYVLDHKSATQAQNSIRLLLDQGHFLCLFKRAASEWILNKDMHFERNTNLDENNSISEVAEAHSTTSVPSRSTRRSPEPASKKSSC